MFVNGLAPDSGETVLRIAAPPPGAAPPAARPSRTGREGTGDASPVRGRSARAAEARSRAPRGASVGFDFFFFLFQLVDRPSHIA